MKQTQLSNFLMTPEGGLLVSVNPNFAQASSEQSSNQENLISYPDLQNLTFHQVAREGDVKLMKKLLHHIPNTQQKKKRLNIKDDNSLMPIHYAARYNHYQMIKFLIENGAGVESKDEGDATPLHFIAKYKIKKATGTRRAKATENASLDDESFPGKHQSLRLLVSNGAQVNPKDSMGLTPLHYACTRGNTRAVRELLKCSGIALEMTDYQGMTGLHLACLYGHKNIVKLLLEAGANLHCKDKDMSTPLHLACAEGSIQVTQLLFDAASAQARAGRTVEDYLEDHKKAQDRQTSKVYNSLPRRFQTSNYDATDGENDVASLLNELDNKKNLPLHLAIENGHTELVKMCIKKALEEGLASMVNCVRFRGDSCLHVAVQANSFAIVKLLIEEGAGVNTRNSLLATPLLLACQFNAHVIVKHLLQNGATIEVKDSNFMTPLLVASRYGHLEAISYLLEYDADITETDRNDRTCFMWAAEENRPEVLKVLLQKNQMELMIEERDKYNNTALHLASVKGNTNVVKLLLENRASSDIKNVNERTALHVAALHGHDDIIPDLVNRDRSIIDVDDEDANTALHLAAIGGNLRSVSALIQLGANIEPRNSTQWTPLDCAAAYGWVKAVKCLLEAGASIQPSEKIKLFSKVCALHLACQRGHVEIVLLLLRWKADVTFRAADGSNALDFAIDFGQKECVIALLKHESWQLSLKNTITDSVTGQVTTPMRKLISKMEDMAYIVCDQCITDNGKKPENEDYTITLDYEFFDDMYACMEWTERSETQLKRLKSDSILLKLGDTPMVCNTAGVDLLSTEAKPYSSDSHELQKNHPLQIMVDSQCETLLMHPIVAGLLKYKWRSYGRYVYYSNLIFFVTYFILLNAYMMSIPGFYMIDWNKVTQFREYKKALDTAADLNTTNITFGELANQSMNCFFYREELGKHDCQILPTSMRHLKHTIFALSVINLIREVFQAYSQRLRYLSFTNSLEVSLYLLSLIITCNFRYYTLDNMQLAYANLTADRIKKPLENLQTDTSLLQEWQYEVGAFAVLFSWMSLLLFIRNMAGFGIFVVMFTVVLKTFARFFVVFVFFIFGFSLAFSMLLGNQFVFERWYEGLIETTVMMNGEFDYYNKFYTGFGISPKRYQEQVYTREATYVLFFIFLIVMNVIIMNLLVGLSVGDIMQVQANATLKGLSMRVALNLEVEFTLPAFLRKKLYKGKEILQIKKGRNETFLHRFLFDDDYLTIERISNVLNKETVEQEKTGTELEKVLLSLSILRGKVNDVIADQVDIKHTITDLRSTMKDVQNDSKVYCEEIQESVSCTNKNISKQIDMTHSGLLQTTQFESNETRGKVDDTRAVISVLQENVELTKEKLRLVKSELEHRMDNMQEVFITKTSQELQDGLNSCKHVMKTGQREMMTSFQELKIFMVQDKYMSSV